MKCRRLWCICRIQNSELVLKGIQKGRGPPVDGGDAAVLHGLPWVPLKCSVIQVCLVLSSEASIFQLWCPNSPLLPWRLSPEELYTGQWHLLVKSRDRWHSGHVGEGLEQDTSQGLEKTQGGGVDPRQDLLFSEGSPILREPRKHVF